MQRGLRDSAICHYSDSPSVPPLQTRLKLDHKCFLCSHRQNKMFLAKCQDRSLPIEIWQLRELRFEWDSYLLRADSSDPSGYRARTESCAQCVCGSLLTIYLHKSCHLLRWKGAQCVRFSQSVNSSGFTRRSPHRSFFWPSKITFLGWLYAIRCQSKLQPWAEMARKQPEKQRGEQTCTIASVVTEWTEANSSNSFLQKPFNEADNIPFLCVNAQES